MLNFNTDWLFLSQDLTDVSKVEFDDSAMEKVNLPHTNKILPHHYFDHEDYQFVSWYRRHFFIKKSYYGKRLLLEFNGVMKTAEVYVNGHLIGEHKGGYTTFNFDISEFVNFGEENILSVKVDSTNRKDIPPEGNLVDFLLFGGIYRNVRLIIVDPLYINWTFMEITEANIRQGEIKPTFEITNRFPVDMEFALRISILDNSGNKVFTGQENITAAVGRNNYQFAKIIIEEPELWSIDNPVLYTVVSQIILEGNIIDSCYTRLGIRSVEFKDDGQFYLNGKPLKLRGLNRHQMFPYIGNAMPDRGQKKDADILKYELGLNFVRSSHYPAAPAFLDRCDEIGLLVFEEIPGWQHIGDKDWQSISKRNVEEMIIRDRNHPSIFIWGVRINESPDNHDFYLETNKIAHGLDSSRATGGVRNFQESELLEDVFTYNDFEFNLEGSIHQPNHKPYMITEYMGHMFPTKSFDSVERLIRHAVRHAMIQDKQYRVSELAGASGWCAFDYNTHADFGSGDRVCYHGVCDMFRLPKFAAYFYRSQQKPEVERVVFVARYLTPSFNEDYGDEIVVFSNCEEIDLYIGDKLIDSAKPNCIDYPGLPHPPFTFKGCKWWEWGASTISNLTAVGKIDGEKVAEHTIYPFGKPENILLKADSTEIFADGADCTRVVVKLKDKNNQTLHLANHPVFFELSGPGRLIGENPFILEAGRGAVFIQAGREPGNITLKAVVRDIAKTELTINTIPMVEKVVLVKPS